MTYRGHTIERRGVTDWRVTSLPEVGAEQIIHLTAARAKKWIDGYLCETQDPTP
jgi:hypothetical protein